MRMETLFFCRNIPANRERAAAAIEGDRPLAPRPERHLSCARSRPDSRSLPIVYRFIHAADIHLDSPLRSLALRNPDLAELVGNATRGAFTRIVDLCLAERVDALILAGDLYDGDQTSMKTARFLAGQLRRLHEAGIAVFIIRGNHDAISRITRELTLPENVTIFGGHAEAIAIERADRFPITIHGMSFAKPQAPESLLPKYRPAVAGAVNIGILHTSLGGAPGHDLYAPCGIADLQATGYDYWALGHIHKRAVTGAVVMPGMPQGRDINESGVKSVTLVTIDDNRAIRIEERPTSIAQFERVAVDASGMDDWRDLVAAIAAGLEQARELAGSDQLVARLRFSGATPLAWRMRADLDLLKSEAENRAAGIGACWIEALETDCRAPGAAPAPGASTADPLTELRRLITEEVIDTDDYKKELLGIAEELRGQLPAECRTLLGDDAYAFQAILDDLARDGADDVLARLQAGAKAGAA